MIETLKFYVNQLSAKRAEIHSKTWWNIGHIIYKQTEGREEGRELWHEFSQRDKMVIPVLFVIKNGNLLKSYLIHIIFPYLHRLSTKMAGRYTTQTITNL